MIQSKVCKDALDTAFEISKLIRYSPKRNAASFDCIKVENLTEEHVGSNIGIPPNNVPYQMDGERRCCGKHHRKLCCTQTIVE